ncbi:hypothetical protein BSKO_05481 [Bryopsis sp. KO-2023]|nr:hypothetical protein BSKO_05481 [Bryopsis sp. KO-2023]
MGKSYVKVYVRTRPTAKSYDGFKILPDNSSVVVDIPKSDEAGIINNQVSNVSFKFDGILENVSQEGFYTTCAHEVVDSVLAGYNGTIFCYGQTGAGKTFTMSGDSSSYPQRGIIPRAIHHVFREVDLRVDKIYRVKVSYLEIYNEMLFDLLAENPGAPDNLHILEENNTTVVRGLTTHEVKSEEEALALFFMGDQGRSVSQHVLNAHSTRSHCIFTVHLETRSSEDANERAVLSKINFVDLAGSERTKKTGVTGQTLKEANFINKSLTFLEQTVNSLCRKDAHVPFRQTKLTAVLRDALGGNCKTVMIANLWCEHRHLDELISTLRFASRVRTLVTDPVVNESTDPTLLLRKYERQINELKQELSMRDALSGRARISYDDLSGGDLRELNQLVRQFLMGDVDVDELPMDTIKHIKETYRQMRSVHLAARSELEQELNEHIRMTDEKIREVAKRLSEEGDAVGDVYKDATTGFSVGQAPASARPTTRETEKQGTGENAGAVNAVPAARAQTPEDTVSDRKTAYEHYRTRYEEGAGRNGALKERQSQLKDIKAAIKDVAKKVNESKKEIDELGTQLNLRKAEAVCDSEIVDDEAYVLLGKLKNAKAVYRRHFDTLKELRTSMKPATQNVAEAQRALLDGFDTWFGSSGKCVVIEEEKEALDAGEEFEKLEMERIMAIDPESCAFYSARKSTRGLMSRSKKRGIM